MICTLQLNIDRVLRSNRMKQAVHMAIVGEIMNTYRILVGESEGKKSL